ncbi:MAG: zinc ABC transporter ATP-binding protein ZnuC [Nitrospinota bacterium]|jgi:zinc transport system ATP-binding protein|nr:zinc ABC transporter ATP-binding protein ZnuC [Nitrospinota bacterium]MDP7370351.1 zinc ABC transporter ATP-binding protein ZnuC [Nitrospinota bacterium]MDP7504698.1 zinc ABC transporter ATP-binding protein ZnuC [Nitrospinota bacterium]MDP7664947.1 zinc ABC transporter ATP-binding protein ZnuC [Nitrospinota bacterium]HJP14569.1 zinc ABC transporter ATP-binding protein ZnuC [Nitrospinota bacterium]
MTARPSNEVLIGEGALIEGKGIGHAFEKNSVLSGVDISVSPGEIVTLIGPNGAGKTTLVRVLLGLLRPDSGEVVRRPGLVVGYLPQQLAIDPVLPMTVRRLLRLTNRPGPGEMTEALAETGAAHLIDRAVQDLSGGELQRVLLARALARRPDLLVLDEPIQGIDISGQTELYELIARIRSLRGCGVLMISHDLHIVMASTDRVVCINRYLCCSGHPETVSRHPEYMAMFAPHDARTLAVYTHDHDHSHDLAGHVVPIGDGEHASPGSPDHAHDNSSHEHDNEHPEDEDGHDASSGGGAHPGPGRAPTGGDAF